MVSDKVKAILSLLFGIPWVIGGFFYVISSVITHSLHGYIEVAIGSIVGSGFVALMGLSLCYYAFKILLNKDKEKTTTTT